MMTEYQQVKDCDRRVRAVRNDGLLSVIQSRWAKAFNGVVIMSMLIAVSACSPDGEPTPGGGSTSASPIILKSGVSVSEGDLADARAGVDIVPISSLRGLSVTDALLKLGFPDRKPQSIDASPTLVSVPQALSGEVAPTDLDPKQLTVTAAALYGSKLYLGVLLTSEVEKNQKIKSMVATEYDKMDPSSKFWKKPDYDLFLQYEGELSKYVQSNPPAGGLVGPPVIAIGVPKGK